MPMFLFRLGTGENAIHGNIKGIRVGKVIPQQTLGIDILSPNQEISAFFNGMCKNIVGMESPVSDKNRGSSWRGIKTVNQI